MKLSNIGERAVIDKLSEFLDIGDDAACLRMGEEFLVLSADSAYAPTHMPAEMTPEQRGKFIVTVNLSDIAAMGAKPLAFLLSYMGPDMDVGEFEAMVKAAQSQCNRFGISLVGGDTKEAKELVLSGFALGVTRRPVLRSGATPGDVVAVTGKLGMAGASFESLEGGKRPPENALRAALEPEPRVEEGILLGNSATSMTDISDGLAVSIYSIAEQSGVGMDIRVEDIPRSNSLNHALYSGGDYELLFTMPEEDFQGIREKANATRMGVVTNDSGVKATRGGKRFRIENKGHENFRIE